MEISYLERRFAFDTFLAHFNPREPGGDHSLTKNLSENSAEAAPTPPVSRIYGSFAGSGSPACYFRIGSQPVRPFSHAMVLPHSGQKRDPAGTTAPQLGQVAWAGATSILEPQLGQNLTPAATSAWQFGQV